MIRSVAELCTPEILKDIARRFELDASAFKALEGYESLVYDAGDTVLKIHHDSYTNKEHILAELSFIRHLADGGADVAAPLLSVNDELVEAIVLEDGSAFLASSFEKAAGTEVSIEDASDELYQQMGQTMAKMHKISKTYVAKESQKRNDWFADEHVAQWEKNVPEDDEARPKIKSLYTKLHNLPTDKNSYGLIHADFHNDNFFLDKENNKITVLDFADCLYGWFAMDIGTAMYYYRRFLENGHEASKEVQQEHGKNFYKQFMIGYKQENDLDDVWSEHINDFLMWRQVDLFLYLHAVKQDNELDTEEEEALERIRQNIINDIE